MYIIYIMYIYILYNIYIYIHICIYYIYIYMYIPDISPYKYYILHHHDGSVGTGVLQGIVISVIQSNPPVLVCDGYRVNTS